MFKERCTEKAESYCKSYPRCEGCGSFRFPTNADRIRAMSDEELANVLTDFSNNGGWVTETGREICYERHIEWLKQPVEVNDHGKG